MSEMVYLNGAITSLQQAAISIMDYGFLYGYGLFETVRAYHGKVFRLEAHLQRLIASAWLLGIQVDEASLIKAVNIVLQANHLEDARIRITVTAGEGSLIPDLASCIHPNVLVTAVSYKPYAESVYQNGFSIITSSLRCSSRSLLPGIKSTSYLENMLMRREARIKGADEAICLNEKGTLAEGSTSNIFMAYGGTVKTPPLESGILPGITRKLLLDLIKILSISIEEAEIYPGDLRQCEEVFLTNSLIGVMPVTRLDSLLVGTGKPGPITTRLMAEYRNLIERELG